MPRELTPPAILRQFSQTGNVPESMLPLESSAEGLPNTISLEDPTRPLRGAFTGILLARAAPVALHLLSQELTKQKGKSPMLSVAEIDEEDSIDARIYLLRIKRAFVMGRYEENLGKVLRRELDSGNLPPKVAYSYERLTEKDSPEDEVEEIILASETLIVTTASLFGIAGYDYPKVLRYDPTAKQMVDLVANSYPTYVHPQTGLHQEVRTGINTREENILGVKYTINLGDVHQVVLIDPSQYHRQEREIRAAGEIKSQRIHCPFAMDSQFTAPFLDPTVDPFETNPLQHTFETLVREHVGS